MSEASPTTASGITVLPPVNWSRRRVEWLCTAMGAWGIGMGFAVYVLLWTHGRPHPLIFLIGLLVAAAIAYVAEQLRDLIREGRAAPAITGPRVVVTLFLLMIIELAVHAGTGLVQLSGHGAEAANAHAELRATIRPIASEESGVLTELGALALAWVVVGAVMARRLSRVVYQDQTVLRVAMRRGVREGVLAGLVTAPACALGSLLVLRLIATIGEMRAKGADWEREMHFSLTHTGLESGLVTLLKLPGWLWLWAYRLNDWSRVAGVLVPALVLLVGVWWLWRRRKSRTWLWVLFGLALLVLAPLQKELGRIGETALLAVVIWCVPGFLLGLVAPLLRGAGDEPRLWGMIAFGAAALLAVLTLFKFAHPWCYAVAVSLVFIGFLFFRGAPLREYWPLAATAMASMVCGVMVVVERATFLGVFAHAHALHQLSSVASDPLHESLVRLLDLTKPGTEFDDAEVRGFARDVRAIAKLTPDRQADELPKIDKLYDRLQVRWRFEESTHYRAMADGLLAPVVAPTPELKQIFRALARLTDCPPERVDRERDYGALLAQVDGWLQVARERAAARAAVTAGIAQSKADMEALLQTGTATEDAARYGPDIGALAADLYRFSTMALEARAAEQGALAARLDSMLEVAGVDRDELERWPWYGVPRLGTGFETQQDRRTARLIELWREWRVEVLNPGQGGFAEPKVFTGDPDELPWRQRSTLFDFKLQFDLPDETRLLTNARTTIEHQRAVLAFEQEPRGLSAPGVPAPRHDDREMAGTGAGAESAPPPPMTVPPEDRIGIGSMDPSVLQLARLAEIREQLLVVKRTAEHVAAWWGGSPTVVLELSLVGSFGFWVTVGLLAAWSLTQPHERGREPHV